MCKILNLSILATAMTLVPFSAEAKFFNCNFTEPFISVLVGTEIKVVTVSAPNYSQNQDDERSEEAVTYSAVDIAIRTKGRVTKVKAGPYTLTVDESKTGSDGMSDLEYPAQGSLAFAGMSVIGGCEVDDQKRVLPEGGVN